MRDIFTDIFENQPLDPMESARRGGRPTLRKRFYERAHVGEKIDEGYPVLLDGKPVRTPARKMLAAPTQALAERIAEEWGAQEDVIDPARMPLTRLANAIIDAVGSNAQAIADEITNYLGTDLVCYRADQPEGLVAKQAAEWDRVLDFAHEKFGARFVQVQGVMHAAQPAAAIAAAKRGIPADAWRLGAVSSITTLTGSALLALALAHQAMDADAVWRVAHADEDWQMSQWGRDTMALARRDFREGEFRAAATVLALAE
jgi:chaperone required for assembly of F1-ATPase